MTASDVSALRPLSTGQLLDRAFRLYRQHFLVFLGIVALVQVPISVAQVALNAQMLGVTGGGETFGTIGVISTVVIFVGSILFASLETGALTGAVADSYLGTPVSILGSYRRLGRKWLSILGALLLAGLIGMLLFLWFLVPIVGWLSGLGILVFFEIAVIQLIPPIIVLERHTGSAAVRRGWDLSRKRFWPVVGFMLVLALLSTILVNGPTLLVVWLLRLMIPDAIGSTQGIFAVTALLPTAISAFFALVFQPLRLTAITLLYFDLRVRFEGFDLALLANSLADVPTSLDTVTAQAPDPEEGHLVTRGEFGSFILLSFVGGLVLVVVPALVQALYGL